MPCRTRRTPEPQIAGQKDGARHFGSVSLGRGQDSPQVQLSASGGIWGQRAVLKAPSDQFINQVVDSFDDAFPLSRGYRLTPDKIRPAMIDSGQPAESAAYLSAQRPPQNNASTMAGRMQMWPIALDDTLVNMIRAAGLHVEMRISDAA
jgi:hypothetical protein